MGRTTRTRVATRAVSLLATVLLVAAACSSDGSDADIVAESSTASTAGPATTDDQPEGSSGERNDQEAGEGEEDDGGVDLEDLARARDAVMPDPDVIEAVARAYCEAWNAPRDVDAMVAMMTDDVVIYDVRTAERHEGPEAARTYVETTAAAIDTSECGPAIVGGDWVAGTYTLSSSETGAGAEGISAVRVLDGKVDWHLAFYTPTDSPRSPGDHSLREDLTASLEYCLAFADPAHDPDTILATMTAEPEIYGIPNGFSAVGADRVRTMILNLVVPTDVNTCGDRGSDGPPATLDHGGWQAGTSATINEGFGLWLEGVSVLEIVDDKVNRHFLNTTTFDGAEQFGELWGVAD